MTKFMLSCVIAVTSFFCCGLQPVQKKAGIQWMHPREAEAAAQVNKKPVIIDLYTNWCGWCKVMDKKTYANKNVASYLQEHFNAVKFNAESMDDIQWGGRSYRFNEPYRTHEFALYLTGGRLSYPTTVIITANGEPQAIPGYLKPADLEPILKYFAEGHYGKIDFDKFHRQFHSSW